MSILFASTHARASSGVAKGTVVNVNNRPPSPPPKSRRTTELPMTAAEYSGNNLFFPHMRFLVHSDRSPDDHHVDPCKHWPSAYVCVVQRIEILVCASPDGSHRRRRLSPRMRSRVGDRALGNTSASNLANYGGSAPGVIKAAGIVSKPSVQVGTAEGRVTDGKGLLLAHGNQHPVRTAPRSLGWRVTTKQVRFGCQCPRIDRHARLRRADLRTCRGEAGRFSGNSSRRIASSPSGSSMI